MTFPQAHAPQTTPPAKSGLAVAALVLGIAAFVFGLVPFFGILLAIVGIVIGILALGKPGSKALPTIGLILSAVAAIANIIAIVVVFTVLPTIWERASDRADDYLSDAEQSEAEEADPLELTLATSTTPCFSFEAPQEFIPNQSAAQDELCFATRQGWGEMDDDDTITYTGVGAIWDQVLVEPVRVETTDTMAPDGEVDTLVDYLEANYFPDLGEVISLREAIDLDGTDANLTRFDSPSASTVTKATLVVKSPQPYETANGPVQFFLITFVIDDQRGDLIIDALVDSWRWKQA